MATGNVVKCAAQTFGVMKFFIYEFSQNPSEGSWGLEKSEIELDISSNSCDIAQNIANQYLVMKGIHGFAVISHMDRDEGGISL
jgi:hypothetical protein